MIYDLLYIVDKALSASADDLGSVEVNEYGRFRFFLILLIKASNRIWLIFSFEIIVRSARHVFKAYLCSEFSKNVLRVITS